MAGKQVEETRSGRAMAGKVHRGGWLLLLVVLAVTAGCAGRRSPTVPLAEAEAERIVTALHRARQQAQQCGCCLDAEIAVSVTASTLFGDRSVGMDGYLQAMFPSRLKFVGINPLGQPVLILAIDDQRFVFILVPDGRAYEGRVDADGLSEYLPLGSPRGLEMGWLFGFVPVADAIPLASMARDPASQKVWLEFAPNGDGIISRLLFDPETGEVARHLLIDGRRTLVDLQFSGFQSVQDQETEVTVGASHGQAECRLPRQINAQLAARDSHVTLELTRVTRAAGRAADHFSIRVPPGFERLVIQ